MKTKASNNWLFGAEIDGNDSWAAVFQSIGAFSPLISEIFHANGLKAGEVENLTPGTNAVFRINDKVIKIFAPIESGFSTDHDFHIELASLQHVNRLEINAPLLICSGSVEDKYLFRYVIMDYITGCEAAHGLSFYQNGQKIDFALQLKMMTNKMNTKISTDEIPAFSIENCLENKRWDEFPDSFRIDRNSYINNETYPEFVYTHGDLTGENLLIDDDGRIYMIDFADSRLAPYYYEWPPIVFALFGCSPEMMEAYFGDFHHAEFYHMLTMSTLIHEFGATIVKQICAAAGVSIKTITHVTHLQELLVKCILNGKMKVK